MTGSKMTQEDVDSLVSRDIIDVMGLSNLEEKKKQALRGKILETVQNRVFNRIVREIKKKNKVDEYEKLTEDTAVEKFFSDNNIDEEKIFLEEALYYKAQLATASKVADAGFALKGSN